MFIRILQAMLLRQMRIRVAFMFMDLKHANWEVAPNLAGKTSRGAGRSGTALTLALQVGAGAVLCVMW